MNASALKYDSAATLNHTVRKTGWTVLGQFATVEAAGKVIDRMKKAGVEARTVLIDGVTVIARGA